jgi:hypothetical protein
MELTSNEDCVFHNNYKYQADALVKQIWRYIGYDTASGKMVKNAIATMNDKAVVEWLGPVVAQHEQFCKVVIPNA